ncbi:tryptophan-rich sensory protein [Flavobacterium sediminilitoris]|uniref:Tryptophan-rich sensory protein n=1 Tax=Flavobacterium sediminilitoris TaxID=2024526 RepID=A0ABY4HNN3_9FLAO|nr:MULTISPECIES: TspO/MBR family protein [Flavobacterium]UOX34470.1 tryptophan-rich sensory protein [Flavobacterium sediminilitoris]
MSKSLRIVYIVVICLAVGYLSSLITQSSITTWYPTIKKPFFNPPNWVFAPVWTILYVMMGIAAGLVWDKLEENKELVKKGLFLFTIQLLLNLLWTYLFFGLQNILLALLEIVLLLLIIYETYLVFKKIDNTAGKLFIPYIAWVVFATILTISIYFLNF